MLHYISIGEQVRGLILIRLMYLYLYKICYNVHVCSKLDNHDITVVILDQNNFV